MHKHSELTFISIIRRDNIHLLSNKLILNFYMHNAYIVMLTTFSLTRSLLRRSFVALPPHRSVALLCLICALVTHSIEYAVRCRGSVYPDNSNSLRHSICCNLTAFSACQDMSESVKETADPDMTDLRSMSL